MFRARDRMGRLKREKNERRDDVDSSTETDADADAGAEAAARLSADFE